MLSMQLSNDTALVVEQYSWIRVVLDRSCGPLEYAALVLKHRMARCATAPVGAGCTLVAVSTQGTATP